MNNLLEGKIDVITGHTLIVDGGAVAAPYGTLSGKSLFSDQPLPRTFAGPSFEQ